MAMTGGVSVLVHTGIPNYGAATRHPVKLYVYYRTVQDPNTNQSTVYTGMYFTVSASYPVGPWTDHDGSYVGTEELTFDGGIPNMTGTRWLAEDKAFVVDHDDEGNATTTIKWKWGVRSSWGQCYEESGSFTIDLPNIPRASAIGATDAAIGSTSSVIVVKQSPRYLNSIKVQFGSISRYLASNGALVTYEVKVVSTNIAFTIPDSFYAEIPDAPFGYCTLVCTTYSDDVVIGNPQSTTFKVTASEQLCSPLVSGTLRDVNPVTVALTGDESKLVRYMSTAECTIEAVARNSASIIAKKIDGIEISDDTQTIAAIETGSIELSATDSRQYSAYATATAELVPYIRLTANVELERTNPVNGEAVLTIWGDYFNDTFGAADNTITARYRLAQSGMSYGEYTDVTVTPDGNAYSIEIPLSGLDYEHAYSAQIIIEDELVVLDKVASVGRGIPVCDWGERDFRLNYAFRLTEQSFGPSLPTEDLLVGRVFFLLNSSGGFTPRIYDGVNWL